MNVIMPEVLSPENKKLFPDENTKEPYSEGKQPYEMTREEWFKNGKEYVTKENDGERVSFYQREGATERQARTDAGHQYFIKQALKEGKEIPENVLNDYPEIKKEFIKEENSSLYKIIEDKEKNRNEILTEDTIKDDINKRIIEDRLGINEYQKKKLIKKIQEFPIYKQLVNKAGEIIKFEPRESQKPLDYVIHFLTKYSTKYKKDIFNDTYAETIKYLKDTIIDYDDRFLGNTKGQDRIYYIKKIEENNKEPYHLVVATDPQSGIVRGWTHFKTTERYIEQIRNAEKELIENRGVVDKEGKKITNNYVEYKKVKRLSPLYLEGGEFRRLQSPQVAPTLHINNIKNTLNNQDNNIKFQAGLLPIESLRVWDNVKANNELFKEVTKKAIEIVKSGVREFANWSRKMINDAGEWIKPHVRKLWAEIQPYLTGEKSLLDPNTIGAFGGDLNSGKGRKTFQQFAKENADKIPANELRKRYEEAIKNEELKIKNEENKTDYKEPGEVKKDSGKVQNEVKKEYENESVKTDINQILEQKKRGAIKSFYEDDIKKTGKSIFENIKNFTEAAINILSPTTFAPKRGIDVINKMKGIREYEKASVGMALKDAKEMFAKSDIADNINFIDRMKLGLAQLTPERDAIAKMMKGLDDEIYNEIIKYKPSTNYVQNHFRLFWELGTPDELNRFRKTLQGNRGWQKKMVFETMSEGKGKTDSRLSPSGLMSVSPQSIGFYTKLDFLYARDDSNVRPTA